jgi:hypothetical protein
VITYINLTINNAIQSMLTHFHTSCRNLIAYTLYRLLDQTNCVIWSIINHTFQKEFLVCRLELREVTFDPIELWTIRHIEDLCDI